jgi:hypothetical protein
MVTPSVVLVWVVELRLVELRREFTDSGKGGRAEQVALVFVGDHAGAAGAAVWVQAGQGTV